MSYRTVALSRIASIGYRFVVLLAAEALGLLHGISFGHYRAVCRPAGRWFVHRVRDRERPDQGNRGAGTRETVAAANASAWAWASSSRRSAGGKVGRTPSARRPSPSGWVICVASTDPTHARHGDVVVTDRGRSRRSIRLVA